MVFYWGSDADENAFRTLSSLVKYNGGFFKSAKQAKFLNTPKFYGMSMWFNRFADNDREDITPQVWADQAQTFFNVEFDPTTQSVVSLEASVTWSEYKGRSVRRVGWMFVIDAVGVVRQYKLAYTYKGTASHPVPEKTTLLFERDPKAVLPNFDEPVTPAEEVKPSNWIGTVGKREEFVLTIKNIRHFEGTPMFYGDTGTRTMTTLESADGDKVIYWNMLRDCAKGAVVRVKATVKKHEEYKGVKQTLLSRATVLEVVSNPVEVA